MCERRWDFLLIFVSKRGNCCAWILVGCQFVNCNCNWKLKKRFILDLMWGFLIENQSFLFVVYFGNIWSEFMLWSLDFGVEDEFQLIIHKTFIILNTDFSINFFDSHWIEAYFMQYLSKVQTNVNFDWLITI